jgi:hypothetical protein
MTNILRLTVFVLATVLQLTSCKKFDNSIRQNEENLFLQATAYLKQSQIGITPHQSKKIDTLLGNLVNQNVKKFKAGKADVFICDLKTYKNVTLPEYSHTYYKAFFQSRNGKIDDAYIYTIHTNFSEEQVNADIDNILLMKSKNFSGQIVTNAINDKFIIAAKVKDGKLENIFELQTKPKTSKVSANSLSSNSNTDDCAHFYVVTTTFWSDGSITKDWDYSFSLCGPCNTGGQPMSYFVEDCDPDYGGGGVSNYADTTNPCTNADSLAFNNGYKNRLDSLKSLTNQDYETAFYSTRNPDGTYTYHKQQGTAGNPYISNSNNITTPISSYMHNHYTGLLSVFSGGDLQQMYYWMKNGIIADPSTFSMSLVTANGTTYMLQIDDIIKFQQFGQTWLANATSFFVFESFYSGRYGITQSATNTNNLFGFLRLLQEYNSGLKFFEGDINTFGQWNPKRFEPDETPNYGTVVNSPCN